MFCAGFFYCPYCLSSLEEAFGSNLSRDRCFGSSLRFQLVSSGLIITPTPLSHDVALTADPRGTAVTLLYLRVALHFPLHPQVR